MEPLSLGSFLSKNEALLLFQAIDASR
jgi:hypothetical protein